MIKMFNKLLEMQQNHKRKFFSPFFGVYLYKTNSKGLVVYNIKKRGFVNISLQLLDDMGVSYNVLIPELLPFQAIKLEANMFKNGKSPNAEKVTQIIYNGIEGEFSYKLVEGFRYELE